MFRNYSGVLKVDGEEGNKKKYDPPCLVQVLMRTMTNDLLDIKTRLRLTDRGDWAP